MTRYRNTETGEFVSEDFAKENPGVVEIDLTDEQRSERIATLQRKRKASLRADRTPLPGYAARVAAIDAEIARLTDG